MMTRPRASGFARVALAFCVATASSCASLDGFLYNPRPTDAYALRYHDDVPQAHRAPPELASPVERQAADGTVVHGVFVARPGAEMATAPTVLYHHGNANNIDHYWARVGHLWSLGANVLVYDYPGYGRTAGRPTEAGLYAAAAAMVAYLHELGDRIDQARIFHYGYSLGGGPATEMAATTGPTRGLVLEATFTSVAALVADGSLLVPGSFVTSNRFDNRAKIRRAAALAPNGVLIFHGEDDDFVRADYGRQLAAEVGRPPEAGPHRLVLVPGARHGDVPATGGAARYDAPLREFLAR